MIAYAGTRSTRTLNPEATTWRDEIAGDFVPSITLYNVESDVLPIIYSALKEAAKKAGNFTEMSKFAQMGAEIETAFKESQTEAHDANRKAEEAMKDWKAAQEAQKAASEEFEE